MTAPAVPLLRETLLAALGDAIEYRRDQHAGCTDCTACQPCPDHQHDAGRAADYQAARTIIASAAHRGTP